MCNICTEDFNATSRKAIECPFCRESACRQCVQTYVLGTNDDPACMFCSEGWSRVFFIEQMTRTFYTKTYRQHRISILMDRQTALYPDTMPYVDFERRKLDVNKEVIIISKRVEEMIRTRKNAFNTRSFNWVNFQRMIDEQIGMSSSLLNDLDEQERNLNIETGSTTESIVRVTMCPKNECNGVLDKNWTCMACEVKVCNKCETIKEDEHECDKETVETIREIRRTSKPCPRCRISIFKITGCDQMFCTKCTTPFSWKSGRIITNGFFHNPHYFEFLNNGGSNNVVRPIEQQEGQCLDYLNISNNLQNSINKLPILFFVKRKLVEFVRKLNHAWDVTKNQYSIDGGHLKMRSKRVDFILNRITKQQFEKAIINNEHNYERAILIHDLIESMCMNTAREMTVHIKESKIELAFRVYYENRKTVNDELERLEKLHKLKFPRV